MDIRELIKRCGESARARGFDATQALGLQVMLAGPGEGAEAMEEMEPRFICKEVIETKEGSQTVEDALHDIWHNTLQSMAMLERIRGKYKVKDATIIKPGRAGAFLEELADIVIRIFTFCAHLGLDLEGAIIRKLEKNEGRPKLHGKEW